MWHSSRAVDPLSFFPYPDTAVFLRADPDPALIFSYYLIKSFLELKKTNKAA